MTLQSIKNYGNITKQELAISVLGQKETWDYALPQDWLNTANKIIPDCYETLRFQTVMDYGDGGCFGTIKPLTLEAKAILDELDKKWN